MTADTEPRLLTDVLRDVSRAFYLTLRVLPAGIREPVGVAYLLARAADTIADTRVVAPSERLRHLLAFRGMVEGGASEDALRGLGRAFSPARPTTPPIAFLRGVRARRRRDETSGEHALLRSLAHIFSLHAALEPSDREAVRKIVVTLTQGMEMDLRVFPPESSGEVVALRGADDLDRYTWYVAGCVGEFWTRVTVAHAPALRGWDVEAMCEAGMRFGKALQLVNVLRDIPRDLRNGRCYLPAEELSGVGLEPVDLLDPSSQARLQPVLDRWTARALEYFESAQQYVLAIPRRCTRLRLAALWPVLIGLATLRELKASRAWLDPAKRVKVSRAWIYRMLLWSIPASFSDTMLRWWFRGLRKRLCRPLSPEGGRATRMA